MKAPEGVSRRYLLLAAGDRLAAVEAQLVRRIVRALPVTPLPGARPELLGLAQFAGEPLPVLDLAQLLGAAPGPPASFPVTVVVWPGSGRVQELIGLAADAAVDLVSLDPSSLVFGGDGVVVAEAALAQGTVEILDLSRLGKT